MGWILSYRNFYLKSCGRSNNLNKLSLLIPYLHISILVYSVSKCLGKKLEVVINESNEEVTPVLMYPKSVCNL